MHRVGRVYVAVQKKSPAEILSAGLRTGRGESARLEFRASGTVTTRSPTNPRREGAIHGDHTGTPEAQSGIAAHPAKNLEAALRLARQFLKERRPDVTIEDGKGHSISGADLAACCRGEKKLTADLRVVVRR